MLWYCNARLGARVDELERQLAESDAQVREAMKQTARMAYHAISRRHAGAGEAPDMRVHVSRRES